MKLRLMIFGWMCVVAMVWTPAITNAQCPGGVCPAPPPALAPRGERPPAALARVINADSVGRSLGSGTLVDKDDEHGLVLTCGHLFREGVGSVSVVFPGESSRAYGARVMAIDARSDLAALAIAAPGAAPLTIADATPIQGEPLRSCGFGPDGRFAVNRGQALGYVVASGAGAADTLELSGSARLGDSGGPVLNERDEVVAVLFGTSGRVVDGTCCLRIREFLRSCAPRSRANRGKTPAPPPPIVESPYSAPPAAAPPATTQPAESEANHGLLVRIHDELASLRGESGGLRSRIDELATLAADVRHKIDEIKSSPVAQAAEEVGAAALKTWLVAHWGPLGLAAAGALGSWQAYCMGAGRSRRRQATRASSVAAAPPHPAPAKPTTLHENQYVPYETSVIDLAWSKAHAAVAQNYPGAVKYLGLVERLKNRILSGETAHEQLPPDNSGATL